MGYGFAVVPMQCMWSKKREEFEVSRTGEVKRNVEKAPWCCGKQMIETIDD